MNKSVSMKGRFFIGQMNSKAGMLLIQLIEKRGSYIKKFAYVNDVSH